MTREPGTILARCGVPSLLARWRGHRALRHRVGDRGAAGGPGLLWGCEDARTDARFALVRAAILPGEPVIVHGSRVESQRACRLSCAHDARLKICVESQASLTLNGTTSPRLPGGRGRRARAPHVRRHPASRPGRRGDSRRARRRPRHAPAEHHRSVDRPAADSQRRPVPSGSSSTARSTTTASCGPSSKLPATSSTRRATPRRSSTPTSSGARARSGACAGCSASRCGTARAARCCWRATAPGSSRCTTRSAAAGCTSGPRSSRSSPPAPSIASSIPRRSTTTCRFSIRRAIARSSRACASCRPGTSCRWRDGRSDVVKYWEIGAAETVSRQRGRRRDGAARCPGRRRAVAHGQRRAARRVPLRRRRLEPRRRADGARRPAGRSRRSRSASTSRSSTSSSTRGRVARHFGTEHHEFVVRPDGLSILDRLVDHFDEPFADSSAIPTWYVSEIARRHVTVVLSGDGGDELFGGYDRYLPHPRVAQFDRWALPGARADGRRARGRCCRTARAERTSCGTSRATDSGRYLDSVAFFQPDEKARAVFGRRARARSRRWSAEDGAGPPVRAVRGAAARTAG